jgi:hypothetical protein
MNVEQVIDYGPLTGLIGTWTGDKGLDVAPDPGGEERNPYFETLTYSAIGDVQNAKSQTLAGLHYRQIVSRKSDGEVFHDETGYWMWDAKSEVIMHSLVIPRAVCVLAGGHCAAPADGSSLVTLEVAAEMDHKDWQIIQSPFMMENARTTKFQQKIIVGNGKLSFSQTTIVDIYGKTFVHTDENELIRQAS